MQLAGLSMVLANIQYEKFFWLLCFVVYGLSG